MGQNFCPLEFRTSLQCMGQNGSERSIILFCSVKKFCQNLKTNPFYIKITFMNWSVRLKNSKNLYLLGENEKNHDFITSIVPVANLEMSHWELKLPKKNRASAHGIQNSEFRSYHLNAILKIRREFLHFVIKLIWSLQHRQQQPSEIRARFFPFEAPLALVTNSGSGLRTYYIVQLFTME